jgi:hypothetical protein
VFSRWRFGRLARIDGQLNGGANLRRGQSIQVGAQVVVRVTLDFLGPMVQNPAHDDKPQASAGP